jgi:hypothetical protein
MGEKKMTTIEITLLIYSVFMTLLYIFSKFGKDKGFMAIVDEVKSDLKTTIDKTSDLIIKSKDIIFNEQVTNAIKEFILIVEEKNKLAKDKGEMFLKGDEKKLEVIRRITDWVSNLTGSTENAVDFIETNKSKIDRIINDYVAFANKMEGKNTLSEAEKLIEGQLNK